MIRVIIGHKVKIGTDIEPILLKLRTQAMQYPGFVDSENLLGEKDSSVVVTISTWERAEDWREWENSRILFGQIIYLSTVSCKRSQFEKE